MKRILTLVITFGLLLGSVELSNAQYTILFSDGFETAWSGDYAAGWVSAAYRHGTAPIATMAQQGTTVHSGSYGLKLTADSVPESWMWWAAVEVENLSSVALDKQYNPYVSAWYYDELEALRVGQVYAVPDWVVNEDWTDVQFGARLNRVDDNYYYVTAHKTGGPGWQDTGVKRSIGWHQLKFQLSSADGFIHFYLDGNSVGLSTRNDYTNLGTAIGLYTMFQNPLSGWGSNKPYTLWDDFEVGSTIPEPGTFLLLGCGLLGLAGLSRKKLFKK